MEHDKKRMIAILIVGLLVIATGILFASKAVSAGDFGGAVLGSIIAVIILVFALFVYRRGNENLKKGLPLHDERSRKVMEKASSKAFYVSLYILLAFGLLSDYVEFRDISQVTGISVGIMALLFLVFWIKYNRQEI